VSDGLELDLQASKGEAPPKKGNWLWDLLTSWGPPLLVVFLIRSILVEPFQIPSGSMVPTLAIGDFILVSKFSYGMHLPFWGLRMVGLGLPWQEDYAVRFDQPLRMPKWYRDFKLFGVDEPARGDIIVFVHPPSENTNPTDYIKRVVGLPGDTVEVREDVVYINGVEQPREPAGEFSYTDSSRMCRGEDMKEFTEKLGDKVHPVLQSTSYATRMADWGPKEVPEDNYFVMGDNRDNSADSRFWGFVPTDNIRGKAILVWLSFDHCTGNIPALGSVRFDRIGTMLN
jgi:signal peptidase I